MRNNIATYYTNQRIHKNFKNLSHSSEGWGCNARNSGCSPVMFNDYEGLLHDATKDVLCECRYSQVIIRETALPSFELQAPLLHWAAHSVFLPLRHVARWARAFLYVREYRSRVFICPYMALPSALERGRRMGTDRKRIDVGYKCIKSYI